MEASVKKNVIVNYIGQGWTALMGLVFAPIYIKYMGAEAYGLVGVFTALQATLILFDMGMGATLTREMARLGRNKPATGYLWDLLRSFELIALSVGAIVSLLIFIVAPIASKHWFIAGSLDPLTIGRALALIGVVIGLRLLEGIYISAIIGLQRQVWLSAQVAVMATIRWGGVVLVLHFLSNTVEAFFTWQAFVSLLSLLTCGTYVYGKLPADATKPSFSMAVVRRNWRFSGNMMLTSLQALVLKQLDKFVLSGFVSLKELGYYTLATAIAHALVYLTNPVTQAVYPRMTEFAQRGDVASLSALYNVSAQFIAAMVAPTGLILVFFGWDLLLLWSRNAELATSTSNLLSLLVAGMVLNRFMHMPYMLQLAYGWAELGVKFNFVNIAMYVPLLVVGAGLWGAAGAAYAWIAVNVVNISCIPFIMHKRVLRGQSRYWYIHSVMIPLATATTFCLVASAVIGDATSLPKTAGVAVFMIVGMVGVALVALFSADLRRNLILRVVQESS